MYRLSIFPILSDGRYLDEIDITNYIEKGGMKKIQQSVDSSDYSIRKNYNSIRLKLLNHGNIFSIKSDRSIFNQKRDGSIVRVSFIEGKSSSIVFEGIISDNGTYEDERKKLIRFTVISFESRFNRILEKNPKAQGVPLMASTALRTFLSNDEISPNFSITQFSIGLDFEIDSPEWFSNKNLSEAINSLLTATNSILFIRDRSFFVFPRDRVPEEGGAIFFGYNDKLRRTPMIFELKAINTGGQRVFNAVQVNGELIQDTPSIQENGFNELPAITIPFITNRTNIERIGHSIIAPFLYEKEEIEVKVLSKDVAKLFLGDFISLDFPSQVTKNDDQGFFSLAGMTIVGEAKMPRETGRIIPRAEKWMIYEKNENVNMLNCIMKLRKA